MATTLFFAILGVASYYVVAYFIKGKTIPAPTLVGKQVVVALNEMKKHKLSVVLEREEASDTREAGEIIDQNPKPGTNIKERSPIRVVVSTGAKHVTIPDTLIAMDKREAGGRLEELGLKVGRIGRITMQGKPGNIVLATDPEPGTGVPAGTAVNLLICADLNERLSTVPDLKGYTPDMAREELLRYGLQVEKTRGVVSLAVRPGMVVDQEPKPGTGIVSGKNIELVLAMTPTPEPSLTPTATPAVEETVSPAIKLDTLDRPKKKDEDTQPREPSEEDAEPRKGADETPPEMDENAPETPRAVTLPEISEEDPEPTEPLHEN